MEKEIISGIYCIENQVNHKKYIGQSRDIYTRIKEHKKRLRCKFPHENRYLQRAWDKYGEDAFTFSVIEKCDISCLDDREIYWISFYESSCDKYGYNAELGGSCGKKVLSETLKQKISNTLKEQRNTVEYHEKHSGVNSSASKQCICVNTQQIYCSVVEAARETGKSIWSIYDCCNNKIQQVKGYQWQYYEEGKEYKLKEINKRKREKNKTQKRIVQLNKDFSIVNTYSSSYEIIENYYPDWSRSTIISTCGGNEMYYKGYIFMYEQDIIDNPNMEISQIREIMLRKHKKNKTKLIDIN